MSYGRVCLLILLITLIWEKSDGQITFNRTYHLGVDVISTVIATDSGYFAAISAGYPIIPRTTNLVYIDTVGNLIDSSAFGGNSELYADLTLLQDEDGNFVSGGQHADYSVQRSYLSIRKWTPQGGTIWTRDFMPDSSKNYEGNWMCPTLDSGYCIAGFSDDTISGDQWNLCCIKVDANGNLVWYFELPTPLNDIAYGVLNHTNGDVYITGKTRNFGHGNAASSDAFLLKLNAVGQFQWIKAFGVAGPNELFYNVEEMADHNLLIAGIKYNIGLDEYSGIWKVDTSGNVIWQKYYQYPSNITIIYRAHELADHTLMGVGAARSTATGKDEGWIFLTDSLGNQLWQRTFRVGSDHCFMLDLNQTIDKGFIIAGFVFDGPVNQDAWLVKLDSLGCDSAGCPSITTGIETLFTGASQQLIPLLCPNPCGNYLRVKTRIIDEYSKAEVYTLGGVWQEVKYTTTRDYLEINTSALRAGLYMLRLLTPIGFVTARFIKE